MKVLYKLTWPSMICLVTNWTVGRNEDSAYFNNFSLYCKMRFLSLKLSKYVHFDHVCQKHIFLAIFFYFKDSNQKTKHQTPCTSWGKKDKANVEVLSYTSPNKVLKQAHKQSYRMMGSLEPPRPPRHPTHPSPLPPKPHTHNPTVKIFFQIGPN